MKIRIVNKSSHQLPAYESLSSAGMDIRADTKEDITIKSMERTLVPTGLYIELPQGCEAQVRPRSGLAINHGVTVLNSPGTIDADYRGEIKVILINLSDSAFEIKNGDRIAQLVVARHEFVEWEHVEELSGSARAEGGFGSTGR